MNQKERTRDEEMRRDEEEMRKEEYLCKGNNMVPLPLEGEKETEAIAVATFRLNKRNEKNRLLSDLKRVFQ